jgi:hypothetical protein
MAKPNSRNARRVLSALIDGMHPATGAELTDESVLQDVDVVRCLMVARDALEAVEARALRRAQLPSGVGKPWSADEEAKLVAAYRGGDSVHKIAEKHARTVRAIEARLERIGLITASQRITNNSFTGPVLPPVANDSGSSRLGEPTE